MCLSQTMGNTNRRDLAGDWWLHNTTERYIIQGVRLGDFQVLEHQQQGRCRPSGARSPDQLFHCMNK